jgi:hypothetical protein
MPMVSNDLSGIAPYLGMDDVFEEYGSLYHKDRHSVKSSALSSWRRKLGNYLAHAGNVVAPKRRNLLLDSRAADQV